MKKIMLIALALIMALASVPALAAQGDVMLGVNEDGRDEIYFERVFSDGNTLYLPSWDTVYVWHVGDAEPTRYDWDEEAEEDRTKECRKLVFLCDGQLYVICQYTLMDEHAFDRATLCSVELTDEGVAVRTPIREMDWYDMVEYYGDEEYVRAPEGVVALNGKLLMRVYGESGDVEVMCADLETGRCEAIYDIQDAYSMVPYGEGKVLVEQYSYSQSDRVVFSVYDINEETVEELCECTVQEYRPYEGLAYDAAADALYCIKDGEICRLDLESGEVGQGLSDMPIEVYGNGTTGCMLEGGFYAFASGGAVVRNLDPEQHSETRIKVLDVSYSEALRRAVVRFGNVRGDVSVSVSRDYEAVGRIVENMMNRDSGTDIYVVYTSTEAFDAVFKRGYMRELDASPAIADLAQRMYPQLREALSYDGHLVALPVEAYSFTLGADEKALELIGLTLDDIPHNWNDFLDFLANDLPEAMKKDESVSLFYKGIDEDGARRDLFYRIFEDYQNYVNATDPAMGYNTDLLRGLLEKLERIDFIALGCEPYDPSEDYEGEEEAEGIAYEYSDEGSHQLFMSSTECSLSGFYDSFTPILMGLDAEHEPLMVLNTTCVFINPFTEHYDEALAFVEAIADALPVQMRYTLLPELNEPVRSEFYEANKQEIQKMIDEAKASLETADPADAQDIEQNIREMEDSLEYFEQYGWAVSQRSIEWLRANDDRMTVASVNWLYSEKSGEAWGLISQYTDHQIGLDEMLEGIDKKVQMMLLEGY